MWVLNNFGLGSPCFLGLICCESKNCLWYVPICIGSSCACRISEMGKSKLGSQESMDVKIEIEDVKPSLEALGNNGTVETPRSSKVGQVGSLS